MSEADEKDALIAQLRERIVLLEVVAKAARKYADNSVSANLLALDMALAELKEHQ